MQDDRDRYPTTQGLTYLQLMQMIEDIRRQPAWRTEGNRSCAFYDGNQLSQEELEEYERRKITPIVINQIKPLVNALLGLEAKTRTDWRVGADSDEFADMAEAMSAKLHEAERETMADHACSEAFASQVKAGLGWVCVTRNADPFGYPYRVEAVHRNEIWWDWHAKKSDLLDARYLVRERWYPADSLAAYFPDERDLIMAASQGWTPEYLDLAGTDERLKRAYDVEAQAAWSDELWRNADSGLVCLREVWYRVPVRGKVIKLPDGRTVEFDKKNPVHALAVDQGFTEVRDAIYTKLRVSLWVGPHKMTDDDYGRNKLPYVPFWGYREDSTRIPYGSIRDMIPLQREINARRNKMQWLLAHKRVVADSDALDESYNTLDDVADEVSRADALIVTNPTRRNAVGLAVETDLALTAQQFEVMHDAGDQMQRVAGIFNSMLGATDGAKSGTAIQGLVEQGNTMQADLTDNYRFGRTAVGQLLLELITQDMVGVEVTVLVGDEGKKRPVMLNRPMIDPLTNLEYRENDVSKVLLKVALNDVPSTPAYRAQAMTMVAEVLKGLPPQLQAPLVPYFLEATELPKRREMADLVRKVLGLGEDGQQPDPEKQQMADGLAQMQQMVAQLQDEIKGKDEALRSRQADQQLKAAEIGLKAEAQSTADKKAAAEIARINAETLRTRADTATKLMQGTPDPQAGVPSPADTTV